jgi:PKD repeat protein
VILEDLKLGVFHNLRASEAYNYVFEKNKDELRFRLHFKPAVIISASTESCVQNDGSITLNSPSNTVWSYNVKNSDNMVVAQGVNFSGTTVINNLTGGDYIINLSNSFGIVQEFVTIANGSAVTASIAASSTNVSVLDATIAFTSIAQGATDITWDFGDGTIVTDVQNPIHMYTEPGDYVVTFIASSANCMDIKTLNIKVTENPTSAKNIEKMSLSIFPNPTRDLANIKINMPSKEQELVLFVIDNNGKLVSTKAFKDVESKGNIILDVSSFEPGVYQLLIKGESFSTNARLTVVR